MRDQQEVVEQWWATFGAVSRFNFRRKVIPRHLLLKNVILSISKGSTDKRSQIREIVLLGHQQEVLGQWWATFGAVSRVNLERKVIPYSLKKKITFVAKKLSIFVNFTG